MLQTLVSAAAMTHSWAQVIICSCPQTHAHTHSHTNTHRQEHLGFFRISRHIKSEQADWHWQEQTVEQRMATAGLIQTTRAISCHLWPVSEGELPLHAATCQSPGKKLELVRCKEKQKWSWVTCFLLAVILYVPKESVHCRALDVFDTTCLSQFISVKQSWLVVYFFFFFFFFTLVVLRVYVCVHICRHLAVIVLFKQFDSADPSLCFCLQTSLQRNAAFQK